MNNKNHEQWYTGAWLALCSKLSCGFLLPTEREAYPCFCYQEARQALAHLFPCPLPLPTHSAAKSLQSCPTLCDPIDGSPRGSPIPGILQARTLEWVAISFSDAWKWKVKVKSPSLVRPLATPWTSAHQAPPSMGFSGQEYWSGVPLQDLTACSRYYIAYRFLPLRPLGELLRLFPHVTSLPKLSDALESKPSPHVASEAPQDPAITLLTALPSSSAAPC